MADVFSTYDAIGNREDLSNMIYDISPMEINAFCFGYFSP